MAMGIKAYIVRGDGACRICRNKLDIHLNASKQKRICGLESRTCTNILDFKTETPLALLKLG